MLHQSRADKNVRKKASLSSANLYLPITFNKAKVLHDCSFCMQPKAKEKRKLPGAQTHGCAERCILCFFSCVFFSRVGKNQWARVTRNKEKTRRGLIGDTQHRLPSPTKNWDVADTDSGCCRDALHGANTPSWCGADIEPKMDRPCSIADTKAKFSCLCAQTACPASKLTELL